jgi:DNA-binding NtrC family response regulator
MRSSALEMTPNTADSGATDVVLLAEDDDDLRTLAEFALRRDGFDVQVTDNGSEERR